MAVVTMNGPIGSCGVEVGTHVAGLLNADYVDRLILAEAAKRIGSTVAVLELKEQRLVPLRDRLAYLLQTMLERSAITGAGGEPYFGPGVEYLPSGEYTDLVQEPLTAAQRLNDRHFIEVYSAIMCDLAKSRNVVIIGRGSNVILKDMPGALHVQVVAPTELRASTIMEREHLDRKDAEKYVGDMEKARVKYFKRFFKVDPADPHLFHIVLNMGLLEVKTAAEMVAHAAQDLATATASLSDQQV